MPMRGERILTAVGLVAVLSVGACEPAPPVPVTQPPEPADVVTWPDIVWAEADMPGPPLRFVSEHIAAVTADASGFVAVGFREGGGRRDGTVWFSAAGRSWAIVGVPAAFEGVDLMDVAAGVGGFVALGASLQEAGVAMVVYRSEDGERWERLAVPGAAGSYPSSVAGGPGGYVVSGNAADGGSATWFSPDGKAWERVARDALGDGGPGVVEAQAVGDGWAALGWNGEAPAFLRSTDGVSWTGTLIEPTEAFAYRLIAGRSGYLVQGGQGSCGPLSSCPAETVTWWSGDGEAWTRLPADAALQGGGSVLAEAGDRGFVGLDGASAWSSATGWSWTPLPEPGDGSSVVTAAVVRDDVIVAVGEMYLEDGTSVGRIIVAE